MDSKVGEITYSHKNFVSWKMTWSEIKNTRKHSACSIQSPNFTFDVGTFCFAIQLKLPSVNCGVTYVLKLLKVTSTPASRPVKLFMSGMGKNYSSDWLSDTEPQMEFKARDFSKKASFALKISCAIREKTVEDFERELRLENLTIGRSTADETKIEDGAPRPKNFTKLVQNVAHPRQCKDNGFGVPSRTSYLKWRRIRKIASLMRGVSPNEDSVAVEVEEQDAIKSKSTAKLIGDLNDLLFSEKNSDVVLKVEGSEFNAHRLILGMRSPVFAAMFEHNMKEKSSGEVMMEGCDRKTFPDFLFYIYTGAVEKLSSDKAPQLYIAADTYQLLELKEECLEYMKQNISVDNFCDIMTISLRYMETDLTRIATQFFIKNGLDIAQTSKWMTFLAQNVVAGNELFIKLLRNKRKS